MEESNVTMKKPKKHKKKHKHKDREKVLQSHPCTECGTLVCRQRALGVFQLPASQLVAFPGADARMSPGAFRIPKQQRALSLSTNI